MDHMYESDDVAKVLAESIVLSKEMIITEWKQRASKAAGEDEKSEDDFSIRYSKEMGSLVDILADIVHDSGEIAVLCIFASSMSHNSR